MTVGEWVWGVTRVHHTVSKQDGTILKGLDLYSGYRIKVQWDRIGYESWANPAYLEVIAPLPDPGKQAGVGHLLHAMPTEHRFYTTCTACGAEVFYDDTDDEGTGIWTHTATLDYFCEAI